MMSSMPSLPIPSPGPDVPFGDFSNCIVGTSPGMRLLTERIRKAAANRDPLRIAGPSGSYKRIVALEVHRLSAAPQAPFVVT